MNKKEYPYKNRTLKNIKGERWKDIPGLSGYFMISNYGRVRRLEYELEFTDGRIYLMNSLIMKPTLAKSPNYFIKDATDFLRITLTIAGNIYNFSIARMVGREKKRINAFWGAKSRNMISKEKRSLPIFISINEASRRSGVDSTTIGRVVNGKARTAGGFFWKKTTEE